MRFLKAERRKGYSEETLVTYRRHLGRFVRFLAGKGVAVLTDVTKEHVFAFWDYELSRPKERPGGGPLAVGTLQLLSSVLHAFFAHLVKEEALLVDPSRDLSGPKGPRKLPHEVPTARQMRRLVLSPSPSSRLGKRDRAILELLYGTGLRASELCGLSLSDVDVSQRQVFVRKGKGGRQRLVPMGKKAAEALSGYLAVRGTTPRTLGAREVLEPLFLRQDGGAIRPPALRYILKRGREKTRLSVRTTPHTLRHACATHLLKGGAGIRQIQVLLGHASLESTEIYTKVETSDLRAMLDRHHPRSQS